MLGYSVCIIYLATPNEEYIIIDVFIKLMAALPATKHIFCSFRWVAGEKCEVFHHSWKCARVFYKLDPPFRQSKTQMVRNKGRK